MLYKLMAGQANTALQTRQIINAEIASSNPQHVAKQYKYLQKAAAAIAQYAGWDKLLSSMEALLNLDKKMATEVQVSGMLNSLSVELESLRAYADSVRSAIEPRGMEDPAWQEYLKIKGQLVAQSSADDYLIPNLFPNSKQQRNLFADLIEKIRKMQSYVVRTAELLDADPVRTYAALFSDNDSLNFKKPMNIFMQYKTLLEDILNNDFKPNLDEVILMQDGAGAPNITYAFLYLAFHVRLKNNAAACIPATRDLVLAR